MTCALCTTALAFGDTGDRDYEAAFGAASTAQTGNFLEGLGPLTMPAPKAPAQTAAQKAAAEAQRKQADAIRAQRAVQDAARQTANANIGYQQQRAKEKAEHDAYVRRMQTEDTPEARAWRAREKFISSARTDWGLIPAGAAVIATGAAIIASGGAVAGALAAPSAASIAGAAVAADRALAAAEKAKLAPKTGVAGKVSGALDLAGKASAALDTASSLASGKADLAGKASAVLDTAGKVVTGQANVGATLIENTKRLAEAGVPGAAEGLEIIARTAAERALKGTPAGVPQALTADGAKAFDAYAAARPALLALDPSRLIVATASVKTPSLLKKPTVEWFVSSTGKVTRGAVAVGSGWRVYSDGKVVKQ